MTFPTPFFFWTMCHMTGCSPNAALLCTMAVLEPQLQVYSSSSLLAAAESLLFFSASWCMAVLAPQLQVYPYSSLLSAAECLLFFSASWCAWRCWHHSCRSAPLLLCLLLQHCSSCFLLAAADFLLFFSASCCASRRCLLHSCRFVPCSALIHAVH